MKKFEIGTYKTTVGTFETTYCIEKVTAKTVTVTIHKGGRYEKTRRCKFAPYGVFMAVCGGIYHLNRKAPLRAAWRVPRYDFRTAPDWKRQNGMNKLSICPVWRLCGRMWGNLPPEPKNAFTGFLARCARQFRRPL